MVVAAGYRRGGALAALALAAAFLGGTAAATLLWRVALRGPARTRAAHVAVLRAVPDDVASRQVLARLDLAAGRPRAARARLAAALRRAPFTAPLWLARAEVALQLGDTPGARGAALRAAVLAPADGAAAERAALVLLEAGAAADAGPALRRAAALRPDRTPALYDLGAAVYGDADTLVRTTVPPDAAGVARFLRWAYARRRPDAARAGWRTLDALGPTAGDRLRHVDFLLDDGAVVEAEAVWTSAWGPRPETRVFDGDFEADPVGGGFGWVLSAADQVRVAVTHDAAARGQRGLAVEFRGGNVAFFGVRQTVPVDGGRRYRLSALVRTEGVTSLAGPRLRVEATAACPALATVEGPELLGTRPWGPVGFEFVTPPVCAAVRILLCRPATDRLDRDLRGRVLLDDVAVRDLGEPG